MHSIKDTLADCKSCEALETLVRVPSHFISSQPKQGENATGDLVKEKIEEFRDDLNKEKEKLSSKEYKI